MRVAGGALVVTAVVILGAAPASADVVVDSIVSRGEYVGAGILNDTGVDQTLTKKTKIGKTTHALWLSFNPTVDFAAFAPIGTGGSGCFQVRYFDISGEDETEGIVEGDVAAVLQAFSTLTFHVEVKVKGCAAPGDTMLVDLDAKDNGSPDIDRARFKVKAK